MQVNIGGDRLGSGNKMRTRLNNYQMSTHDLSQKWTSSMQVGTLYPFLCIPAMRGDKFTINLNADARTIPTKGPLFGSFKMQVDLFQCDDRLYQALLHNNPLALGMNMKEVKFPILKVCDKYPGHAFSNSSLLKYLGMSGLGTLSGAGGQEAEPWRTINAIPALAYYEIFKTYYANKQEEDAYIITTIEKEGDMESTILKRNTNTWQFDSSYAFVPIEGENFVTLPWRINIDFQDEPVTNLDSNLTLECLDENDNLLGKYTFETLLRLGREGRPSIKKVDNTKYIIESVPFPTIGNITVKKLQITYINQIYTTTERGLQPFKLSNIDEMRLKLLSHHTLGTPFEITKENTDAAGKWGAESGEDGGLPYVNLVNYSDLGNYSRNCEPLNGLCIKTYQSDIFNNWVNTEWIDGENGISAITAISTAEGSVTVDSLNLAEKLYNMLNRVAVSDGSYEGWQDAVYTETPKRHIESPVYLGGMSSEIVFEEIVQTSPDGEGLGTLAGKGRILKRKGGRVTVKCNEAAFIIGIVSLTPRVNYSQGNEWYMTELRSMDDLHKPALDGIGFENLIGERMAWWDTHLNNGAIISRSVIGKVPAWINYMTAVDKCYGDFAETEGRGFMNLLREYTKTAGGRIADATTYIDPRKYNYAFAYTDIDAQNFWVQIYSEITARRLMSAKQIPNI